MRTSFRVLDWKKWVIVDVSGDQIGLVVGLDFNNALAIKSDGTSVPFSAILMTEDDIEGSVLY